MPGKKAAEVPLPPEPARPAAVFPPWLVLDNNAKIWPAILSRRYTTLFRLSAVLDTRVNLRDLQHALDSVMERFPYFRVCIRRGLFWYHLETRQDLPSVEADARNPCMNHRIVGKGRWPFRVRVFNNRISLEISHIITDGSGALVFLMELVSRYLAIQAAPPEQAGCPWITPDDSPREEEWQDDYPKLHIGDQKRLPTLPMHEKAYHPAGRLLPPGAYRVVSAWCDVKEVLALSKATGLSLTEYLCSALLFVLQEQQDAALSASGKPWLARPIILNVPVNLRKLFPSKTLRNFFSFSDPGIDPRLGYFTLEEIQEQVHHHMKFQINEKRMRHIGSRNLRSERKLAARLTPLFIKDLVLNLVFQGMGDQRFSASFSNLGALPAIPGNRVKGFVFLPPPSPICKINVSSISYGDRLCISFAGLIDDMDLARRLCVFLTGRGVKVYVESNDSRVAGAAGRNE